MDPVRARNLTVRARDFPRFPWNSAIRGFLRAQTVQTEVSYFRIPVTGVQTMPTDKRDAVPRVRTVGRMAAELQVPIHRVVYILRTRPHIRPIARAGRARLYDVDAQNQVSAELRAIMHGA